MTTGESGPDGYTLEQLVEADRTHRCDGIGERRVCLTMEALATLPTKHGDFRVVGFEERRTGVEHLAIVRGEVAGGRSVPVRIHSECLTGDVLGSLRCDCGDQLHAALAALSASRTGVLLYLRQEGRGIGLVNKLRAYALQEQGLDTVDANLALGFRADERDYAPAAHMLASLRVRSVLLLTNNPDKVRQLEAYGVRIAARVPHLVPASEHCRRYLETKARRCGHLLSAAVGSVP